jgi:hypothetical protein
VNGVMPASGWLLVAPWFRWPAQGVSRDGLRVRETKPAIQKYATSNPAGDFVKQPQHSLKFLDEDFYQYTEAILPALPSLPPPLDKVKRRLNDSRLVTSPTTRKLFLDSHHRMYLAVVQLVRDEPGFPCVKVDNVCQSGFVIRRRRLSSSRPLDRTVGQIMRDVYVQAWRQQEVSRFLKHLEKTDTAVSGEALLALLEAKASVDGDLLRQRARLAAWAHDADAGIVTEGWIPGEHDKIGSWQPVLGTPQVLSEKTYPLHPVVPDPKDREHDAQDASLYFGLIPTSGSDVDDQGNARFDDGELYEVRCYTRRHDPRCPKNDLNDLEVADCHGPLTWSLPSEAYRLAAPMDLVGTSNHVVTIQAPDMPALAAQSTALGTPGPLQNVVPPVKMTTPAGSSFQFAPSIPGLLPGSGSLGDGSQACFFMIPLFTIVALFLFNLFLPIIMLVFQLWWMLALKICIPPSASLAGNVTLELNALGAMGINLSASATLDDQFGTDAAGVAANVNFRNNTLLPHLTAEFGGDANAASQAASMRDAYSTEALVRLHQGMQQTAAATAARSLSARLVFEDPVYRSQVVLV